MPCWVRPSPVARLLVSFRPVALLVGLSLGALALLGVSCTQEEPAEPPNPYGLGDCPEDSILTWDNAGGPFVLNWCASCHGSAVAEEERAGAPLEINLESHSAVRERIHQLIRMSVHPGKDGRPKMPLMGRPPQEEIDRFAQWLRCGAP